MKKLLAVSLVTLVMLMSSIKSFAEVSFNYELKNIVQLNECTFRFDVYITNTSPTPAIDFIAIQGWQFQVGYNVNMLNGGALNNTYCTYIANTTELDVVIPTGESWENTNIPVSGNTTSSPTAQVIQSFSELPNVGGVVTYIDNNTPLRIGTFQVVLKTTSSSAVSKNFASVAPNFYLIPSGAILSTCLVEQTDVSVAQDGSIMKWTRSTPEFVTVVSRTLTNPASQKDLFSYCFTGTGNYADVARWNNIVGTTGTSYHTLPTAGTNVSIGGFTNATTPVVSAGACTLSENATLNDLTINSGSSLSAAAGKQLTVGSGFTNNGTLSLLSDATGTATILTPVTLNGTGTANVQQYVSAGRNWYMSSPVAAATTSVFSNALNVYSYPEATGVWATETAGLTPLKGYIAEIKTDGAGAVTFAGALNSGAQSTSSLTRAGTVKSGFNLVGNPYPSYLDWSLASTTNLDPSIWYRTRNSGNTAYIFDTYNVATGLGTDLNGTALTSMIPPMQAFWVRVSEGQTAGTISLDNTMRAHQVGTNLLRSASANENQVIRLQVSNGENKDEAIVVFNANASDEYDAYDSYKMSNDNAKLPEIFTLAGDQKVVINGFAPAADKTIALGFASGVSSNFTIKATEISNFDSNASIILKDNLLKTETNLTEGNAYNFTSDVANTTDRFSILVIANTVTAIDDAKTAADVKIFTNAENQITVSGASDEEGSVTVSSIMGQNLLTIPTSGTTTVISRSFRSGVYLVTVKMAGITKTQKVIIK
jgi:hypothetical protein